MPFQVPTFDSLLNDLLTDYKNQFPEADTSRGSLIFVKASALASSLWGLYKYQEYISRQIFPDTSDTENLEHHAFIRGLARKAGESDAGLLARLMDYIRRPPAGGNQYDYVKWALSIAGIKSAYSFPLANGPGTVDVVVVADPDLTGSIIPDQALLDEVKAYIDTVRPVTAWGIRVLPPEILEVNVTMSVSGSGANPARTAIDISAYLGGMSPSQPLYLAQLINLAVINGADNAVISAPAYTITPLNYQVIRPGVVNVA